MRKLLLSASVMVALGLTGCGGGENIADVRSETPVQTPFSRIVFDPANGNLNVPNDLLMLPGDDGFFDYTLNIPVADPTNFGDPQNALNVLDGWSVQHPFVIEVNVPAGSAIDASTLSSGVLLYEATLGLDQSDPDCAQITTPSAGCKVGDQLQYGVDYVLSLSGTSTINVVPLRPLKAAKGHMLVMTTALRDTDNKAVRGSETWESVRQDPAVNPLSSPSQLQLQNLVNSYITSLEPAGLNREEITYVAAFTTQSTQNVLQTVKQLMVAEFAARFAAGDPAAGESLPVIVATDAQGPQNAMETLGLVTSEAVAGAVQLGISQLPPEAQPLIPLIEATDFGALQTCDGLLGTVTGQLGALWGPVNDFASAVATGILQQAGPFCAATRLEASISLPYFLAIPRADNPLAPVNEFWEAACDSGIVLAGAPQEALAAATPGPNAQLCQQVGLADLRINGEKLDYKRNLTKFSPIPQPKGGNNGDMTLDVQVTVPNPAVAAGLGFPIEMPEAGWPVVILAHGITRQKEDMLALTGALSLAGFATVAIDHPLHGSRGFDLDGDGTDDLNATTVSALHYMNLASLPTARDNLRQSVSDLLGLRLGLNAFVDASSGQMAKLDGTNVSLQGVSLGAITGGNTSAVANTPFSGQLAPLSGMFALRASALESPGGGQAQFLLESPAFGPLIKGSLLTQASPEFQNFLISQFGSVNVSEAQLTQAVTLFLNNLSGDQLASANAVFSQFAFAAQTVLDAADPTSYAATLGATTPVLMQTVVGDGGANLPDQVIPVATQLPNAGQHALARNIGLEQVVSSTPGTGPGADTVSGQVRFNAGAHGSSLSPASSAAVTTEMQRQIATYIATGGRYIQISNPDVVSSN
ncbi:VolA/Pla-1 family phospholipase [Aestuariibacter salexigens]|uniref:VolA/Pla-1 family phospholipase n=1 Tax=Aestuariibacter salexigens TaxID=226010 RepID=UPI000411E970|nr:VolA/Pla-1 family phospholipase [Aestuariibacter salexigens]